MFSLFFVHSLYIYRCFALYRHYCYYSYYHKLYCVSKLKNYVLRLIAYELTSNEIKDTDWADKLNVIGSDGNAAMTGAHNRAIRNFEKSLHKSVPVQRFLEVSNSSIRSSCHSSSSITSNYKCLRQCLNQFQNQGKYVLDKVLLVA